MKKRKSIPKKSQEELLIECGYKCSVPRCNVTESLEFHHVNMNPEDNRKENVIILCAVHHHKADIKRITVKACLIMKEMLQKIDGLSLSIIRELSLSVEDFSSLLDIGREMSMDSLRLITREYISYLSGKNEGYQCRRGLEAHDFLVSKKLLLMVKDKAHPPLWKISEKGILFCKFLYNSQYFLPLAAFDKAWPISFIIRWNFEKLPWE